MNFFDNTDEKPAPIGLSQYAAEKLAEFEAAKPVTSTVGNSSRAEIPHDNGSVFDQLDQHADWYDDILASAGWAEVKPGDSATLRAFRRPGATYPISAKVLKANPHVLVVWSEDAGLPIRRRAETNHGAGTRPLPLQRQRERTGEGSSTRRGQRRARTCQ